jgi:hypothetical protein
MLYSAGQAGFSGIQLHRLLFFTSACLRIERVSFTRVSGFMQFVLISLYLSLPFP